MSVEWPGRLRSDSFSEEARKTRKEFEQVVRSEKWDDVLSALKQDQDLINESFLDSSVWYSPLHYLTEENAPVEIIERTLSMGAWRTLKTLSDERAIDIALRKGRQDLVALLTPTYRHTVDPGSLSNIQKYFHDVIIGRINKLPTWSSLRLPDLEVLLEIEDPSMWFPVPGMYGGFNYELILTGKIAKLVSESWIRIVGGSGQRHEITSMGSKLVEEGFV